MNIKQDSNAGVDNTGKDKVVLGWKLPAIVFLVSLTFSGMVIAAYFYLQANPEISKKYLPSDNVSAADAVDNFMEPVVYAVFGGALFLMFATIIYKGVRIAKETKRLQTFGSKAYCRVDKAENLVYRNKSYTSEYKKITITTPMGKVGVYDLPISSPVKEGDSVLIMYDPSDADAYRLVFEKGDAVIKK